MSGFVTPGEARGKGSPSFEFATSDPHMHTRHAMPILEAPRTARAALLKSGTRTFGRDRKPTF